MSSKTTNKKAIEIAKRSQHLANLQLVKRQKNSSNLTYSKPERLEKKRILIVCEGLNTEPSYFSKFRLTGAKILSVCGAGETIRVVERATIESKKAKYDQVWVVFDKDDFPVDNFDNAISKAKSLGFEVAYSNQAFEYWFVLHFEAHQGGALHRSEYPSKINEYLSPFRISYDGKNSKIVENSFFEVLNAVDSKTGKKRIESAIERAKSICEKIETTSFAAAESSTTVFKLVQEILKYQ